MSLKRRGAAARRPWTRRDQAITMHVFDTQPPQAHSGRPLAVVSTPPSAAGGGVGGRAPPVSQRRAAQASETPSSPIAPPTTAPASGACGERAAPHPTHPPASTNTHAYNGGLASPAAAPGACFLRHCRDHTSAMTGVGHTGVMELCVNHIILIDLAPHFLQRRLKRTIRYTAAHT
jgi:hypothetical protein